MHQDFREVQDLPHRLKTSGVFQHETTTHPNTQMEKKKSTQGKKGPKPQRKRQKACSLGFVHVGSIPTPSQRKNNRIKKKSVFSDRLNWKGAQPG